MNIGLAKKIIGHLVNHGVEEFVLCAGARNAPIVKVLGAAEGISVYNFFEERSAGFFALGKIKKSKRPVAVVTTSGTAVGELLPSVMEAYYAGLPLVVISADRPVEYRGSGAPQAVEQVGIFGNYVGNVWDVSRPEQELDLAYAPSEKPIQINVCFDEPLLDEPVETWQANVHKRVFRPRAFSPDELRVVKDFWFNVEHPLVIVGQLPLELKEILIEELLQLNAPIYAEAGSGLIGEPRLSSLLLRGSDKSLPLWFEKGWADGVVRFGSVPTVRLWRDLDGNLKYVPVLSVHTLGFSGLARARDQAVDLECYLMFTQNSTWGRGGAPRSQGMERDRLVAQTIMENLKRTGASEPAWIRRMQEAVHPEDFIFIGNSLPIREWDLVASLFSTPIQRVAANRGTNGIDGLISTFLGMCELGKSNWCLVGDLSALYDLSSLWALKFFKEYKINIVVMNNGGGKIFERVFQDSSFENPHHLNFKSWAQMFNVNYCSWSEGETLSLTQNHNIIEIIPEAEKSKDFWEKFDEVFQ